MTNKISPVPPLVEIQIDVAWDCPVGVFLQEIEKHEGSVVNFISNGPAGGNPLVTLLFMNEDQCNEFRQLYENGFANPVCVTDQPQELASQTDQPE